MFKVTCPACGKVYEDYIPENCSGCGQYLRCPDCHRPLRGKRCKNKSCKSKGEYFFQKDYDCPRCGTKYDWSAKFCPSCGLQRDLKCTTCGVPVSYGTKFCKRCGKPINWDSVTEPENNVEETKPVDPLGSFVITPYGPMYVFDVPAPKKPAPKPVEAPVKAPQPVVVEEVPVIAAPKKKSAKAILGLIFSILGVLVFPVFPFSLIGIILGALGRKDRKKVGTVAIVLGVIGLALCIAAVVWAFAFGGSETVLGWLKGWGLLK